MRNLCEPPVWLQIRVYEWLRRIQHRKCRETKLQPSSWPGLALLGCSLVSLAPSKIPDFAVAAKEGRKWGLKSPGGARNASFISRRPTAKTVFLHIVWSRGRFLPSSPLPMPAMLSWSLWDFQSFISQWNMEAGPWGGDSSTAPIYCASFWPLHKAISTLQNVKLHIATGAEFGAGVQLTWHKVIL